MVGKDDGLGAGDMDNLSNLVPISSISAPISPSASIGVSVIKLTASWISSNCKNPC